MRTVDGRREGTQGRRRGVGLTHDATDGRVREGQRCRGFAQECIAPKLLGKEIREGRRTQEIRVTHCGGGGDGF